MLFVCFSELYPGDSGSIVYFVDKQEDGKHRHYPWGMLVRKNYEMRGDNLPGFITYEAVVLDQVFKDIAVDYQHLFSSLSLYQASS